MPRIVRFHHLGGPDALQLDTLEIAPPDKGEVQIRVKALGLNRAEAMFRSGNYIVEPHFPSRIGYEAAGIVEALGEDVTGFTVGDAVSTIPAIDMGSFGVYGEVATVPAFAVVKHPSSLSFVEAAAVWMQYLTAFGALIDIAEVTKGDFVVIPAASSSVGLAAIQLCQLVGATSIATTRTAQKRQALKAMGADHVIVTQDEDLASKVKEITQGKGARVIFDPVGGKTVVQLMEALKPGGILFEYGALSPDPTPFPVLFALSHSLTMRGYIVSEILDDPKRLERAKKFLFAALESGKLKPIIAKTFPFEEIVEAHRYLESNQQFGKIVVTVP